LLQGQSNRDNWSVDDEIIAWWTNIGSYSSTLGGWHNYAVGPDLVCPAIYHCTEDEMIYYLSRYAYPGQNPFKPVSSGDINIVWDYKTGLPGGQVVTYVDGLAAVNKTLRDHVFYDGVAVRTVFQGAHGGWYISTHSYGNNWSNLSAQINTAEGPGVFTHADVLMLSEVIRDH
jgi:hypothetical protein